MQYTTQSSFFRVLKLLSFQNNNGDALSLNMSLANTHAAVVEHLIIFADRFFPGEVSGFNICFCRGTAT